MTVTVIAIAAEVTEVKAILVETEFMAVAKIAVIVTERIVVVKRKY